MKKAGIAAALGLMACGQPQHLRDLTDEERKIVDQHMEIGEHGAGTVEYFVEATAKALFGADGKTIDAQTFNAQIAERADELRTYYEEDAIFAYTSEEGVPGESAAYHHADALDAKDTYIALNADYIYLWSYGVFMHEVAHGLHTPAAEGDKDSDGHADAFDTLETDAEMAALSWELHDLPNVYMALHKPNDEVAKHGRMSAEALVDYAARQVEAGWTPEQALAYYDESTPQNIEEWIASEVEYVIHNNRPFIHELGLTEDDVREGMRRGTLFEYTSEIFSEKRAELSERIREFDETAEAKRAREKEREMPRPGKKL